MEKSPKTKITEMTLASEVTAELADLFMTLIIIIIKMINK
jgi:hypothetical protein